MYFVKLPLDHSLWFFSISECRRHFGRIAPKYSQFSILTVLRFFKQYDCPIIGNRDSLNGPREDIEFSEVKFVGYECCTGESEIRR
jgi:hypothetical protein